METIVVQINNKTAYRFLEDLEELELINVIKKDTLISEKLSDKYKGVFSEDDANSFNEHTSAMRKEWDNT
jgi:hypothetical protein